MQIRTDAFSKGGGDLVQMLKTKEALDALGLKVDVTDSLQPELGRYDLVHLFNLSVVEDTYKQALNAHRQRKPLVLSSIYWDKDLYLLNNPNLKTSLALKLFGKDLTKVLMENRKYYALAWHKQKSVLNMVDSVFATSKSEINHLKNNFSYDDSSSKVIPLGIDAEIFKNAKPERFIKKYGIKDFVLCVGRIEDLKNQISIIKAVDSKFPIVFVGGKNYFFKKYVEQFEREIFGRNDILYIDKLSQAELADAYAAARVCAGASWFETFHLASIEALSVGTPVVTTKYSPLHEYFNKHIFFCDPADIGSISGAVSSASKLKREREVSKGVLEEYSWKKAAEKINAGYKEVLKRKNDHRR